MLRRTLLSFAGMLSLAACADDPVAPPQAAVVAPATPVASRVAGVATLGTLTERKGSTLTVEQRQLEFVPAVGVKLGSASLELSIGRAGDALRVLVDASTQIYVNGEQVTSIESVPVGAHILVGGVAENGALRASIITDLAGLARNPKTSQTSPVLSSPSTGTRSAQVVSAAEPSRCIGQLMDYFLDETAYEFHGCWGGPSITDNIDLEPNIPWGCGVLGCWVIDKYGYTFAAGGWTFDFPFRFGASSTGLTYHVPGPVTLSLKPLPATADGFTFTGGFGVDFFLNVDLCNLRLTDCLDIGTIHLSEFSVIQQTTDPGTLKPADRLQIGAVACPSVGIIGIPDTPIDVLSVAFCQDLGLNGRSFATRVKFDGTRGSGEPIERFDGSNHTLTVTPDALSVDVSYSEFVWTPEMTSAYYFQLNGPLGLTILETRKVSLGDGPFEAVSTPFPNAAAGFSLATDPQSPELLHQPLSTQPVKLHVAPAPTTLTIISSPTLDQALPFQARLTESYDGSPIAQVEIRFTTTDAGGTQTTSATTNANGVAQIFLPNGEHDVTAEFQGSDFYLSSRATQHVFVYLATTFVIWGGNAGGVDVGNRYHFWGSQWRDQVTGGDFAANASFKGYAGTATGATWVAGGGNSVRPPNTLAELIGVIVATMAKKDGNNTVGNISSRVILRVEDLSAYRPNPGHAAFGTMAAVILDDVHSSFGGGGG